MEYHIENMEGCRVVYLKGDLDLYTTVKFRDIIGEEGEHSDSNFIIDLKDVGYIDSCGIGALLFFFSAVKKKNYDFYLTCLGESVFEVLKLNQLIRFFPVSESVSSALLEMNAKGRT
jgi:anti-anti-sigma factor